MNSFTRAKIAQIDQTISAVNQLRKMRGHGGVNIQWIDGIPQINDSGAGGNSDGSIFARITGRSGFAYAFTEVGRDATGALVDIDGGITGTTTDGFAVDINGLSSDLLFAPTNQIFRLFPSVIDASLWEFNAVMPVIGPIYANITGRSGKRYSFDQVAVDASDNLIAVAGGISGNITTTGYAIDVGGIANDILFDPTPQTFLLTPNPLIPKVWMFGPVILC